VLGRSSNRTHDNIVNFICSHFYCRFLDLVFVFVFWSSRLALAFASTRKIFLCIFYLHTEKEEERAAMHDLNILCRPSGQGQCNCLSKEKVKEKRSRKGEEGRLLGLLVTCF